MSFVVSKDYTLNDGVYGFGHNAEVYTYFVLVFIHVVQPEID